MTRIHPAIAMTDVSVLLAAGGGGLIGAVLSAGVTYLAAVLRESSAKREEWWRRVQWAADLALTVDAEVGYRLLTVLVESDLAGKEDAELLAALADRELFAVTSNSSAEDVPSTEITVDDSNAAADDPAAGASEQWRQPGK